MVNKTAFITGATRGLGLEFVKQYAADNWHIYACARDPENAQELHKLAQQFPKIEIHKLDVTSRKDIAKLKLCLNQDPIDHMIHNAGIAGKAHQVFREIEHGNFLKVMETNALAPLSITELFYMNLLASTEKLVITISSAMGSITENASGRSYAYRTSKAAVNMIMKNIAVDLQNEGIKVLLLNPGWVRTDLGGKKADLSPTESVRRMRKLITKHGPSAHGEFYNHDGRIIAY